MVRDIIKNIASRVPICFTQNQRYDKETRGIMRSHLQADSNCIDIGCHKGEILREMLKCAPNGEHYAFEPLPSFYKNLADSFPKNCHIFPYALSNSKGTREFQHVVSNPPYSGFRKRRYEREETVQTIRIETAVLDEVLPSDYIPDFIKIDVEGAELEVLKGAVNTIKKYKPVVVFEHGLGGSDYYQTTPDDVFNLLVHECGLNISLMSSYILKHQPLSQAEFSAEFHSGANYYFIAYP